jgi:hypothetical protein
MEDADKPLASLPSRAASASEKSPVEMDALQVQDRQQRLDRPGAAHVGRQDRWREADAVGIVSRRPAIAHAWLTHGDRTDAGHHLALGQMAMANHPGAAILGLQIRMLGEETGDLGLDGLREQGTGPVAQDFGELVVEGSWLNQSNDVIVGHGISLLRWRSEVVKQPHDMPPSRFPPSPTSAHSSKLLCAVEMPFNQSTALPTSLR